jgi:hypothetical protein
MPLENQLSEDRGRIICYLLATQPMHTNDRNIGGAGEEKKWKIKNKNPLAAKIT